MRKGKIRIGTSGWAYRDFISTLYPPKVPAAEWLQYYASQLSTVEILGTIHKHPKADALYKWYNTTPKDFVFSAVANKQITHSLHLLNPRPILIDLIKSFQILDGKMGPIVFQPPPRILSNFERFKKFAYSLQEASSSTPFVFEFLDPLWMTSEVKELLLKLKISTALSDAGGFQSTSNVSGDVSGNFVYIRLHGSPLAGESGYSTAVLKTWAERILSWSNEGKDLFVYFGNTLRGQAIQDVSTLKSQIELINTEIKREGPPRFFGENSL